MSEYKIGEIFRHYEDTFQCVENPKYFTFEEACAWLSDSNCWAKNRSDGKDVHYMYVTEPEEGMMFRASNGRLYELRRWGSGGDCGCYTNFTNNLTCYMIQKQAFKKYQNNCLHWYPVEEKKEEEARMEEGKRHIELAIVKVDGDQVTFKISEQTHRCDDFAPKGCEFKSHSGYRLISESCPHADACIDGLFVRGWLRLKDDTKVKANSETFARIMEAVTEYNETDGMGYEKLWPKNGDNYFFINSDSTISAIHYTHDCIDEMRRSFGNVFRTREEAEAALERVKKALKGE